MKRPILSVVITAHCEGLIAHKTVMSALAGLEKIKQSWEIVVNVDNGDKATRNYFARYTKDPRFVINKTSLGDPGSARNAAIQVARGKYITVLDGDDLLSSSFFEEFFRLVEAHPDKRIMVHPGATMQFGENIPLTAWPQFDSDTLEKDAIKLVGVNRWTASSAAEREVFLESPYVPSVDGYGYEDWWLNQQVVACGVTHYVADSVLFYRKKTSGSMFALHENDRTVVAYTDLLALDRVKNIPLPPLERVRKMSAKGVAKRLIKLTYKAAIALPVIKIPALAMGRKAEKKVRERRYASLPQFVLDGWAEAAEIENIIVKSPEAAEHIVYQSYEDDYIGIVYRHLVEHIDARPVDRLYMMPGRMSGLEKKTLVRAIELDREKHPDWHIVVLTRLGDVEIDGVDFVDFSSIARQLTPYEKDRMFSRLLVQLQTRDLVVGDSSFFLKWVADHKKFISSNSFHIMAMVFDDDSIDPYLIDMYSMLAKVITSDKRIIKRLVDRYAFDKSKIQGVDDAAKDT